MHYLSKELAKINALGLTQQNPLFLWVMFRKKDNNYNLS